MELIRSATHPSEVWALLKFKFGGGKDMVMPKIDQDSLSAGMRRCYELLNQTSRSFAAVIQALDDDLRPAICIFYLVLRALDTVEDDMHIPLAKKVAMLKVFHTHLYQQDWRFMESTEKDKAVLEEFPVISGEFRCLAPVFQEVIADITEKMGNGMTVFLSDKVDTMADWNQYCHYVAGLVGIGLSRLFSASGLEVAEVGRDQRLANSMGLFLQKTNIIRDYLEDVQQGREFWPKAAWSQFGASLSLLEQPEHRPQAVCCLNLLVTNALRHVPDVLTYMDRIRNQSVFNFCAIPQTMAIATLAACYNNPRVFTGVVKIRKGQAVQLMMASTNMDSLRHIMASYTLQILQKVPPSDPSSEDTRSLCRDILTLCGHQAAVQSSSLVTPYQVSLAGLLAVAAVAYVYWEGDR